MRDGTSTRLLPICSPRCAVMPMADKIGKQNTVEVCLSIRSISPNVTISAAATNQGAFGWSKSDIILNWATRHGSTYSWHVESSPLHVRDHSLAEQPIKSLADRRAALRDR